MTTKKTQKSQNKTRRRSRGLGGLLSQINNATPEERAKLGYPLNTNSLVMRASNPDQAGPSKRPRIPMGAYKVNVFCDRPNYAAYRAGYSSSPTASEHSSPLAAGSPSDFIEYLGCSSPGDTHAEEVEQEVTIKVNSNEDTEDHPNWQQYSGSTQLCPQTNLTPKSSPPCSLPPQRALSPGVVQELRRPAPQTPYTHVAQQQPAFKTDSRHLPIREAAAQLSDSPVTPLRLSQQLNFGQHVVQELSYGSSQSYDTPQSSGSRQIQSSPLQQSGLRGLSQRLTPQPPASQSLEYPLQFHLPPQPSQQHHAAQFQQLPSPACQLWNAGNAPNPHPSHMQGANGCATCRHAAVGEVNSMLITAALYVTVAADKHVLCPNQTTLLYKILCSVLITAAIEHLNMCLRVLDVAFPMTQLISAIGVIPVSDDLLALEAAHLDAECTEGLAALKDIVCGDLEWDQ